MLYLILQFIIDKVPRSIADAFARLYEEFMPKVFRYINYRIVDVDEAQDLTETVFEKALVNFESYSTDRAGFSTWIFSIARNTLVDHYRFSAREQSLQTETKKQTQYDGSPSPDYQVVKTEEMKILQSCISQLSPQEREIISLKFGGEMTNRQIAKLLGMSESNVGTTAYRIIRKLRDKFKEEAK